MEIKSDHEQALKWSSCGRLQLLIFLIRASLSGKATLKAGATPKLAELDDQENMKASFKLTHTVSPTNTTLCNFQTKRKP